MGHAEKNESLPEHDVPPQVWEMLHEFLLGIKNPELDLREPHLKPSLRKIYPFIIFMYSVLLAVGVLSNLAVFIHIVRHKLYKDGTYSFILNNVISDVIKCVIILPISLYVLLIQNWMLGELLCSFLPMLQVGEMLNIPILNSKLICKVASKTKYMFENNPYYV